MRCAAGSTRCRGPGVEILCVGTERGLETRVIPAAGYELALIPPVPLPRKPSVDLLKVPARLRGAVKAARRIIDGLRRRRRGRLRWLRLDAGLRRCPTHQDSARDPRGQRPARRRQPVRRARVHPTWWRRRSRTRSCRTRASSDCRSAEPSRPSTGPTCGRWRASTSASTRTPPTLLVTGGSQGARRINQSVSACAADFAAAGVQVLHVKGPKGEVDPPAAVRRRHRRTSSWPTSTGWIWRTPPPTRWSDGPGPTR